MRANRGRYERRCLISTAAALSLIGAQTAWVSGEDPIRSFRTCPAVSAGQHCTRGFSHQSIISIETWCAHSFKRLSRLYS